MSLLLFLKFNNENKLCKVMPILLSFAENTEQVKCVQRFEKRIFVSRPVWMIWTIVIVCKWWRKTVNSAFAGCFWAQSPLTASKVWELNAVNKQKQKEHMLCCIINVTGVCWRCYRLTRVTSCYTSTCWTSTRRPRMHQLSRGLTSNTNHHHQNREFSVCFPNGVDRA